MFQTVLREPSVIHQDAACEASSQFRKNGVYKDDKGKTMNNLITGFRVISLNESYPKKTRKDWEKALLRRLPPEVPVEAG